MVSNKLSHRPDAAISPQQTTPGRRSPQPKGTPNQQRVQRQQMVRTSFTKTTDYSIFFEIKRESEVQNW